MASSLQTALGKIYATIVYALNKTTEFDGDVGGPYDAITVENTQGLHTSNLTDGELPDARVSNTLTCSIFNPVANVAIGDYNFSINTSVFFVDSTNDRVGIGTSSPDSIFHIKANIPGIVGSHAGGQIIIQNPADDNESAAVITGYESDDSGNPDQQLWYLGSSSSSGNEDINFLNRRDAKLTLGTNDTTRITILGNGNVGIGTSSPSAKLDVAGDFEVDGTDFFVNSTSGYVGIGTITPTTKLDVVGTINSTSMKTETLNVSTNFRVVGNITCFNAACTWFANASNSCMQWPSGGTDCGPP